MVPIVVPNNIMFMRPLKHNISSRACFLVSLSLVFLVLLSSFSFDIDKGHHSKAGPQDHEQQLQLQLLIRTNQSWEAGQQLKSTHDSGQQQRKSTHDSGQQVKSTHDSGADNCDGRRIYMYDLPEEFNAWILQQCHAKIVQWLKFCPHILNHGFGRPANDSANWADWYETDPYMLEVIFHSRMIAHSYPCTTQVARQADAFFIPYYSGLDALHYLYGERKKRWGEHGLKLVRWLMEIEGGEHWRRRGGHDHFIVMGRTAWDFTRTPISSSVQKAALEGNVSGSSVQKALEGNVSAVLQDIDADDSGWGTSFASLPAMENVTALFLERRPWAALEQAIPYPTGFHPTSLQSLHAWQHKVRAANRTFLMAFVGAPRPLQSSSPELGPNIRQAAIDQCVGNGTACSLLDCSKLKCAHKSVRIAKHLLDAQFCLQPPGDTATRRSTFDGLLSGCIPVFFMNDSAYSQYTWHLPGLHPSSYSVFVPGDQLHRLLPLLSSFSAEHIARMRSFIVEHLITRIIYVSPQLARSHPSLLDGFQLTLDNMLRRVATKRAQNST